MEEKIMDAIGVMLAEPGGNDGPCGRGALADVYIMLNDAANGGEE